MAALLAVNSKNLVPAYNPLEIVPLEPVSHVVGGEVSKFAKWMLDNNVISLGIAFVVGNEISEVFDNIMRGVISPVIARALGKEKTQIEDLEIDIFGVNIKLGKVLFGLFRFYIMLVVLFYLSRLLPASDIKA